MAIITDQCHYKNVISEIATVKTKITLVHCKVDLM